MYRQIYYLWQHHEPCMANTVYHVTQFWLGSISTTIPEIMQTKSSPTSPFWQLIAIGCDKDDHAHHYFSLPLSFCASAFVSLHLLEHFTCSVGIPALSVTYPIHYLPHLNHTCCCILSCIHRVHMLCIIALGGLQTCGSHFISVVPFVFFFCFSLFM